MKLVIVESPTKAKTIGRFLGDGYIIKASMGHVMDLPKSTLGVDVDHNFAPLYEVNADKKEILAELKKLAKEADGVILATDPDREGEAISAHIEQQLVGIKKNETFDRIVFHEITKEAIDRALQHPGKVNEHLVEAQTARRVLDRLVGYKLSPILWQKVRRGLSAGRVQSVALRLIVEREREIEKFAKEEYWSISIDLKRSFVVASKRSSRGDLVDEIASSPAKRFPRNDEVVSFNLVEINQEKVETSETHTLYDGEYTVGKTIITSEEQAQTIEKDIEKKVCTIAEVLKKETKRSPQPPFTTSTLQQQAAQRFGFSGKRTMSFAQKLYEEGYITYHRTDSVNLANAAVSQMRDFVAKTYGEKYIPEKPRFYATKQKLAQEAHEAIRPTRVATTSEKIKADLGVPHAKLYDLIWIRAVASQMADALVESTTVTADAVGNSGKNYRFKANGSVLVFDGFLKINPFGLQDKKLPIFTSGEQLDVQNVRTEKHETPPPPRYNDASLIKSLEEGGIGRPSTYATIISTIETRNYIERDQGRFVPTAVGLSVNDFLVKNFSNIDDIPFTAGMEDELDSIANGEKEWVPMIKNFYVPFEKKLEAVKKADRVQIAAEETGEKCPKDGAPLVVRVGRFGKFISCKNFPTCDFKKAFVQETNFLCPKDGGKIIARKTRKGRTFYGCANYPTCDFAVWKLSELKNPATPPEKKEEKK